MRDSSKHTFQGTVNMMNDHDHEPPSTFQKASTTSTIETSVEQQQQQIAEMEIGKWRHTWKAFVFILLVLGAIVGAWVIVFYKNPSAQPETPALPTLSSSPNNGGDESSAHHLLFDLPTPEECAAISRGETVQGQRNMLVEFLDVEVDVSYEGGVNNSIGGLLSSLETTLKERLVPALSGCSNYNNNDSNNNSNLEGASSKLWNHDNNDSNNNSNLRGGASSKLWNHAVIANTFLELQDRPGMSCSDQSPRSCRRVSLSLQVFLKKDIADSTLRQMILNLGQSPSSLLELLDLEAPYTAISFVDVTPGTPMELTWNPTMAPTKAP